MSTSTDVAWSSDMDPQHPSLERNDEVPDSTLLQKSPNQDPQKPQLPQPKASIWRRIQPIWPLEILAILAAIGLLMAVIIVLSKFHDREITEWSFFINLSTFVTILATLLRISILYAVAEIISQLKWIWFTQYTRPVIHLHDFDQASRGFLGSLFLWKMLARQKPSSPGIAAAAAAFVVVVSFALGSFAQQSLSTGPCEGIAVDLSSSIPVANYVRGNYYRIGAGLWELAVDMRSAMVQGLTKPGKSRSDCPSRLSQREFKCVDRSGDVDGPGEDGNITLNATPSDVLLWIKHESGKPYLSTSWDGLRVEPNCETSEGIALLLESFNTNPFHSTQGAVRALGNVHILASSNSPCKTNSTGHLLSCPHNPNVNNLYGGVAGFIAATCTISPCLRTYNGVIRDGVFHEDLVSTTEAVYTLVEQGQLFTSNYTAMKSPCVLDPREGTWYTEANISSAPNDVPGCTWDYYHSSIATTGSNITVPNACLYKLNPAYAFALSAFLSHLFSDGKCTYDTRQSEHLLCLHQWWLTPLYNSKKATFQSLNSLMDNLTTAATNLMRTTGFGPDEMGDPSSGQWRGSGYGVRGEVIRASSCTYFDWRWLLFPSGLLAISMTLLAWTVALSWPGRVPLWKDSVLPLLFHGLVGTRDASVFSSLPGDDDGRDDMTVAGMEKRAKGAMASCSASLGMKVAEEEDGGPEKDAFGVRGGSR